MTTYWVSCKQFTMRVIVDEDGRVFEAAPVARRFKGQKFSTLCHWLGGFGGLEVQELGN